MNEETKNIETCLPEDILAEVANVPTDAQFRSLVNESLDPLRQQAADQTGWDAYEQVVQSHKPYTFTSPIVQMKSNLILLLRRLWRFPFGTGTIRSLADMWQHYIDRLSGNAEYGIPSRLDQLTALPSAPLLLADRKISGVPEAVDGMSLARLLGDGSYITQLIDNSLPWDLLTSAKKSAIFTCFPSLSKVKLNCKRLGGYSYAPNMWFPDTVEELQMDELERFEGDAYLSFPSANQNYKVWSFPKLKYSRCSFGTSNNKDTTMTNSWTEKVLLPSMVEFGAYASETNMCNFTALKKVVLGTITKDITNNYHQAFYNDPNLIHLEFGADGGKVAISLWLNMWNPTNALDASRTDLVPQGSTAENNLQQFLQNFHDYIAERLATFPEGTTDKTLTLSAAVYSAIWDNNGDPLPTTICQEIDTIIVDTKHWRPNKAS